MQRQNFSTLAVVGSPRNSQSYTTHSQIYHYLIKQGKEVLLEQELAQHLQDIPSTCFVSDQEIAAKAQAIICVGGDGNMLRAALRFGAAQIPLIGVNKGNLGFLTDIDPHEVETALDKLLDANNYYIEQRTILQAEFIEANQQVSQYDVFNEVAILGSREQRIVEVEVYVDGKFAFGMRGDGLIIATPTGSTAYNISAGGPIVHPGVNCVILTPMAAHSLSVRPVVIPTSSEIEIHFKKDTTAESIDIYCDGQLTHPEFKDTRMLVRSASHTIPMIHFNDYNYYGVLAKKLNWSRRLF